MKSKKWTYEEETRLESMYEAGLSIDEIVKKLRQTKSRISSKLQRMYK